MENPFVEQELPEKYDELVSNDNEMALVREKSLKKALEDQIRPVIRTLLVTDSPDLNFKLEDLYDLYEVGQGFLYKVSRF